LKTACLLCLGTYVAVIGIFIVSAMASSVSVMALPGRLLADLGASFQQSGGGVVALAFILGTAFVAFAVFPKEGTIPKADTSPAPASAANDFAAAWATLPRTDLGIPADGAKVVVVKFNDYQCGGCRVTHEWYKPILEKFQQSHPGAVKYVLKDWPWSGKCNFFLDAGAPAHSGACDAAAAVRMARDRGPAKITEMEDWLFANQVTLTPESVRAAAEKILSVKDYNREYADKLAGIRQDVADGGALKITTTPTLFINGVRVDHELMPASYFEMAIQLELNKAAGK
jgi:protein-disulfide isomerase